MQFKITFGLISALVMGIILSFQVFASAGQTAVVIIANKGVPVDSLSKDEIKMIFLAKKTQWDNGDKIEFVTLKKGATNNAFLKQFLQKTPAQFQRYFRTLIFTGKGVARQSFDSEKEVVADVAANKWTFGYVSPETDTKSVKVMHITD